MDAKIVKKNDGTWTVGSVEFDSYEAAELYLKSRAKRLNPGPWVLFSGLSMPSKIIVVLMVLVAWSVVASFFSSKVSEPQPIPTISKSQRLMAKAEEVATLINMNGQLCGRVTAIEYVYGEKYSVTCTRFRDGTGSATYEVNLDTGLVK